MAEGRKLVTLKEISDQTGMTPWQTYELALGEKHVKKGGAKNKAFLYDLETLRPVMLERMEKKRQKAFAEAFEWGKRMHVLKEMGGG